MEVINDQTGVRSSLVPSGGTVRTALVQTAWSIATNKIASRNCGVCSCSQSTTLWLVRPSRCPQQALRAGQVNEAGVVGIDPCICFYFLRRVSRSARYTDNCCSTSPAAPLEVPTLLKLHTSRQQPGSVQAAPRQKM